MNAVAKVITIALLGFAGHAIESDMSKSCRLAFRS